MDKNGRNLGHPMIKETNKRNGCNLRKKRKIAKDRIKTKETLQKLSEKHNETIKTVRSAVKLTPHLINLDSDDPMLESRYLSKKSEDYNVELEQYILNNISKIRESSGLVSKFTIFDLAKKYKTNHPECTTKITEYFIKAFKKKNNIQWRLLHGESRSANYEEVYDFF